MKRRETLKLFTSSAFVPGVTAASESKNTLVNTEAPTPVVYVADTVWETWGASEGDELSILKVGIHYSATKRHRFALVMHPDQKLEVLKFSSYYKRENLWSTSVRIDVDPVEEDSKEKAGEIMKFLPELEAWKELPNDPFTSNHPYFLMISIYLPNKIKRNAILNENIPWIPQKTVNWMKLVHDFFMKIK